MKEENNALAMTVIDETHTLQYVGADTFIYNEDDKDVTIGYIRNKDEHIDRILYGFRQWSKAE